MNIVKYRRPYPVGDGWQGIVQDLIDKIIKINPKVEVTQIKEKFGTLRFYCYPETDNIRSLIEKAEQKSAVTCEVCGNRGKLRNLSWILTLCDKHYKERSKKC